MRIICTKAEKAELVYLMSKSPICPPWRGMTCPKGMTCEQCVEDLFEWEIKE